MRSKGGAVLVYTDLSVRSDAVVEAAAELATSNRMDLYVMHALELRNRPLREVLTSLERITAETEHVKLRVSTQMARLLPEPLRRHPPIIELDARDEAIRRCVQHISPSFVLYSDGNEIVVRDERRPSEPVPA